MIEQWLAALEKFELLRSETERDELIQSVLSDEDIADALWLAAQMGGNIPTAALTQKKVDTEDGTTQKTRASDVTIVPPPIGSPPPTVPAYPQNAQTQGDEARENLPDTGLPLDIQAAPALQNAREIGRALRPLMRKAPSRVVQVFDELATVDRIAEEEIWFPVLKPAPERWFDLELVVEDVPLSFVWEASLAEFQQVLQRQGAFRHIRTWQVSASTTGEPQLRSLPVNVSGNQSQTTAEIRARSQASPLRSPKELIEASKRGLVMYVSDCRSELWRSGTIHKWLKLWGQHGPVTLVQLLPERLWQQTALKAGFRVQVSAFSRGVANTKLRRFNVPLRYREDASLMLTLPAITLTEKAISQWAQVVMAAGEQRLPARLFTLWMENAERRLQDEEWAVIEPETPEDRLELFEATSSAPAQRLARLMSVVPVELPVVHIVQRAFFKDKASPIHVAEVYNSCLIKQMKGADTEGPKYDFEKGVRSLLNRQNLIDESFNVLDVVSQEIARSLGFEINSFTALLLPDIAGSKQAQAAILPFAQIATDVLYRLGGEYAQLAQQVDSEVVTRNRPTEPVVIPESEPDFELPEELKILEFYQAQVREETPPLQLLMDEFTVATVEIEQALPEDLDAALREIAAIEDEPLRVAALIELAPQLEGASFSLLVRVVKIAQKIASEQDRLNIFSTLLPYLPDRLQAQMQKSIRELEGRVGLALVEFEFEVATLVPRESGQIARLSRQIRRQGEWEVRRNRQTAYQFVEPLTEDTRLEMVAIAAGKFTMGSPESEPERFSDESPQREVSVTAFYMGKYPITQAQWRFVAALEQVNRALAPDPSRFKGNDRPVERVSWEEAVEFCDRLSQHTGNDYQLPTEAQWEYACRAGTTTPFHFGDTILPELANYDCTEGYSGGPKGRARSETTPVDEFEIANAFGLCDMHGNVWEWCADHWHSNYNNAPIYGSAWLTNDKAASRVIRGGSWNDIPGNCRAATRNGIAPVDRDFNTGFRVCCRAPRTLQPPTD
jgi:formylglycine-generating enzyme required for sulfatase activity